MRENLTKRFLKFVNKTDTCWLWNGAKFRTGYGAFSFQLKPQRAHRIAWLIFCGEIPGKKCVLHRCDVRLCVKPSHLFLGTYRDNIRDMMEKGRRPIRMNKLSEESVNTIRKLYDEGMTKEKLSKLFGVWPQTVGDIVNYRTWKHLAPRPT